MTLGWNVCFMLLLPNFRVKQAQPLVCYVRPGQAREGGVPGGFAEAGRNITLWNYPEIPPSLKGIKKCPEN